MSSEGMEDTGDTYSVIDLRDDKAIDEADKHKNSADAVQDHVDLDIVEKTHGNNAQREEDEKGESHDKCVPRTSQFVVFLVLSDLRTLVHAS
jgi:hypothetical protein